MNIVSPIAVACMWLPMFGAASDAYNSCSKAATSQSALNACAVVEAKRVDRELNRIYDELLRTVQADALAREQIKRFERAWVAYRGRSIEAMFPAANKQGEYGTEYIMQVNLFGAKLTEYQIQILQELLANYRRRTEASASGDHIRR